MRGVLVYEVEAMDEADARRQLALEGRGVISIVAQRTLGFSQPGRVPLLEFLAVTPEWVKRFRSRRRDLLRAAGARLLPAAVFERSDKTFFTALGRAGLAAERQRIEAACARVAREPGVHAPAVRRLVAPGSRRDA